MTRAEHAEFFGGKCDEDDVSRSIRALAQGTCGFEQRGHARRVVVGAEMRLVTIGSEGARATMPEVVVVGADENDPRQALTQRSVGR